MWLGLKIVVAGLPPLLKVCFAICHLYRAFYVYDLNGIFRVSTKWLNLLRKICAIFAQIYFLRTFAHQTRKTRNIFCEICAWNEILVLRNFFVQFAQNRKFYAKCKFLGKLSKIDVLSLELNNWRCIPYIKHINIRVG